MNAAPRTVKVEAARFLELLYDWRAVYHANGGVEHAFALAAFANTIYHFADGLAQRDWLHLNDRIELMERPPTTGKMS